MGASQSSTARASKFSGHPTRARAHSCYASAPSSASMQRRSANTMRNAKEFSKFWSGGGNLQSTASSFRKKNGVRRSNSARRAPRAVSADPSLRSPPRMVPSGCSGAAAAASAGGGGSYRATPADTPVTPFSTPRAPFQSYTPTTTGSHSPSLAPSAFFGQQQQRVQPAYHYQHRASLSPYCESALAYRSSSSSTEYYSNGTPKQTSIY